ncbi:MAG: hypothetical protein ACK56I_02365, partial [bacterium]
QIGRGRGQGGSVVCGDQPVSRALQGCDPCSQPLTHPGQIGVVGQDMRRSGHVLAKRPHRRAAVQAYLAPDQVDGLDRIRALIDRGDACVPVVLGGARLLHEA